MDEPIPKEEIDFEISQVFVFPGACHPILSNTTI